jgi:integration host factor subunit beta
MNGLNSFMDKVQLIKRLLESNPELKTKEVESTVKVILDAMGSRLTKGGRVEIRGFGSFSLGLIQSRQKRNSITDVKTKVPMKYVPQFKVAKELRERVGDIAEVKVELMTSALPATPSQFNTLVTIPAHYPQHGIQG